MEYKSNIIKYNRLHILDKNIKERNIKEWNIKEWNRIEYNIIDQKKTRIESNRI